MCDGPIQFTQFVILYFQLTGKSGEIVTDLYVASLKDKNFDKIVSDLQGFVSVVESSGLVIDRFFQTSNYSDEECSKVLDLLFTNKEPLSSFSAIKDVEVKEVIVDNEGNLDTWKNARKSIQGLSISDAVKNVITDLAKDGKLNLVKPVATKAAEVRAITSKTADVVVTSAVALTKAQQDAISKALPTYTSGQTVSVTYSVDPAVLGGLLITIGNKTIDLSSTTKLVDVLA